MEENKIMEKSEDTKVNQESIVTPKEMPVSKKEENSKEASSDNKNNNFRNRRNGNDRRKRFSRRPIKTDFETTIVKIKKVTKVVKGGRRFRFSILVVVGNKKGQVGIGLAKAYEVPDALKKAQQQAKKNLLTIPLIGEEKTIPHEVIGNKGASKVILKPAKEGTGIIAGGAVRVFLELAGIKNVYTKALGSRQEVNVILALINAFEKSRTQEKIASLRGKEVEDIKA